MAGTAERRTESGDELSAQPGRELFFKKEPAHESKKCTDGKSRRRTQKRTGGADREIEYGPVQQYHGIIVY